jgi:hypothetical protein
LETKKLTADTAEFCKGHLLWCLYFPFFFHFIIACASHRQYSFGLSVKSIRPIS